MRDLFRLIALALISCAVVGAAMVYSREGDVATSLRGVASTMGETLTGVGQQLAGSAAGAMVATPTAQTYPVVITRANPAQWMGLAGFPDQTELSFPIPAGGHYLGGALVLTFDSQLTQAGDGLLTVSVDGKTRQQLVLDGGRTSQTLRIDLTTAELAQDNIVLGLAGRGTTSAGQTCPTDAANSGSAVTLSADSRLELVADQPLTDAVGTLIAAPSPLVLATGSSASEAAMVVWASQQLNRNGIAARIGVAGADETAVTLVDYAASAAGIATSNQLIGQQAITHLIKAAGTTTPSPLAWPVTAADLGAETSVRSFRGSRRWSVDFAAADLPGGQLPEQFTARLQATPLTQANDWMVRVTLNGNLLKSSRFDGSVESIALVIDLPAARLLPQNSLVVDLVDTTVRDGTCRTEPDAQAQLLPESALTNNAPPAAAWARLIEQLASQPAVNLASSLPLDAAQGTKAGTLLTMLLPSQAKVRFDDSADATLTLVDRAGFAAALGNLPEGQSLVAVLPRSGAVPFEVMAVPSPALGPALALLEAEDVFVIIAGL
ncbi:hypothetical protein [Devosia beringensis]|uniref:hypothetical protein n=1 Tax=Devosia beringensis TaxID=2657486 RepID=UPI00186BA198|nr:hypothetical protein [Devosia beringensis]